MYGVCTGVSVSSLVTGVSVSSLVTGVSVSSLVTGVSVSSLVTGVSVSSLVTGVSVTWPVAAAVVMLVTYHVSTKWAYLKVTSAWHQLTQTHQLLSQLVVFIDIPLSVCLSGWLSV